MQLTECVYLVGSGSNGFNLSHENDSHVYLVNGGSEMALIDAGVGTGMVKILENIRSHGLDPERIRALLLTHVHADHAGGAAAWQEALPGLRVMVSRDVAGVVREGDEEAICLELGKKAGYYAPDYVFQPCPVEVELKESDEVQVGELRLRVLETPGHSAGHLAFVMEDAGRTYLFSGDTLFFGGKILLQNIWDCDLQAHIRTLYKLAALPVDVFLPGHQSVCLSNGRKQFKIATDLLDRGLIPPSIL